MQDLLTINSEFLKSNQVLDWAYTEKLEASTYKFYEKWVDNKLHGELKYLEDHRKLLRKSLTDFYPEAQSSLVFLFSYQKAAKLNHDNLDSKIASYVKGFEGFDYHYWIKDKLTKIANSLKLSEDDYKLSIDMQPVLERDLASRAGLGWFGKNSMLINTKHGSFFIIASIILNNKLVLIQKKTEVDQCGTCTRCVDACPTNAIIEDRVIDSKRCISHFTIEIFKDRDRPIEFKDDRPEIFGCDICQSVCPWNTKPLKIIEDTDIELGPLEFFNQEIDVIKEKLEQMSNREFRRVFKATPLERTGRVGLLKNISITS
jgi:epoxyqueuosine reductase